MRLLVVEDDLDIGLSIKRGLEARCFCVDWEQDGEKGSWRARTNDYDCLILDDVLPGKKGGDICRELRARERDVPIIMISAQAEASRKVDMLNGGADDYLLKPFSLEELVARIRALMRRPRELLGEVIRVGEMELDIQKQEVLVGGRAVYFTRKEFQLLEYFMRSAGRVVSRSMLLEHVWDLEADPLSNTIETHVMNLRRKLGQNGCLPVIKTIPGRGYIIETS